MLMFLFLIMVRLLTRCLNRMTFLLNIFINLSMVRNALTNSRIALILLSRPWLMFLIGGTGEITLRKAILPDDGSLLLGNERHDLL